MLLVYRKDTGKVLHYTDYDGKVRPTLLGLYHACIKKNYPDIKLEDLGEYYSNDKEVDENGIKIRQKIFKYDTIIVEQVEGSPVGLRFEKNYISDIMPNKTNPDQQIADLQKSISDLQIATAAILGGAV